MLNSVPTKILLSSLLSLLCFGCSAEKNVPDKQKSASETPIIVVDNDHTQVRRKGDMSKHLIYDLKGPVKEFFLDTRNFNFDDYKLAKPNETSHKAIQIMHAPASQEKKDIIDDMKVYTMPFNDEKKNRKLELLRTVDSGNIIVIAIGWESEIKGKIDMKPVWLGSIRVK